MSIELSQREEDILRNFAIFGNSKDVANSLWISYKTVETHLARIRSRAGLTTTLEAIASLFNQLNISHIESHNCFVTPREFEVLRLLAAGKSGTNIAKEAGVSKRTIQFHLYKLLQKNRTKEQVSISNLFSTTSREVYSLGSSN